MHALYLMTFAWIEKECPLVTLPLNTDYICMSKM